MNTVLNNMYNYNSTQTTALQKVSKDLSSRSTDLIFLIGILVAITLITLVFFLADIGLPKPTDSSTNQQSTQEQARDYV
jgi:hypothetical protein